MLCAASGGAGSRNALLWVQSRRLQLNQTHNSKFLINALSQTDFLSININRATGYAHTEMLILEDALNSDYNVLRKLKERVKELSVLHKTARTLQDEKRPEGEIIRQIVDILPEAWQFSDVTVARISFGPVCYQKASFKETPWRQTASC